MPVQAVIYVKCYDLKNVLRRPMTPLVTLHCLTITYDRAGFTYKSLRNHVQKYYTFFSQRCVRTLRTLYVYATKER